ncbi:MAG: hypothetical protein OEY49_06590 [Candidatus Heimdallarchaeota archaeon]|nr:hypothetical protein [Candidatus Heimdallarchaeota archaeon]
MESNKTKELLLKIEDIKSEISLLTDLKEMVLVEVNENLKELKDELEFVRITIEKNEEKLRQINLEAEIDKSNQMAQDAVDFKNSLTVEETEILQPVIFAKFESAGEYKKYLQNLVMGTDNLRKQEEKLVKKIENPKKNKDLIEFENEIKEKEKELINVQNELKKISNL